MQRRILKEFLVSKCFSKMIIWKWRRLSDCFQICLEDFSWLEAGQVVVHGYLKRGRGCSVSGLLGFLCLVISCNKRRLMECFLWLNCHHGPYGDGCHGRKVLSSSTVFVLDGWLSSVVVTWGSRLLPFMALPFSRFNEQMRKTEPHFSQFPKRNQCTSFPFMFHRQNLVLWRYLDTKRAEKHRPLWAAASQELLHTVEGEHKLDEQLLALSLPHTPTWFWVVKRDTMYIFCFTKGQCCILNAFKNALSAQNSESLKLVLPIPEDLLKQSMDNNEIKNI